MIVTETEVTKLRDKLLSVEMEMSHPVYICTEEEARAFIHGQGKSSDKHIFPRIWKENLIEENFNHWKQEVQEIASRSKDERSKKETELESWKGVLGKVREFLLKYPFELYVDLKEQFKQASDEEVKQKGVLYELNLQIEKKDKEIGDYHKRLSESKDIYNGLESKLSKGNNYLLKRENMSFTQKS